MKPKLLFPAWIFVSHSTRDIRKVRLIRNYLERSNAEPLLFRLKCLDSKARSIPTFLQAEMRARQFFLLCDSRNARGSPYVRQEVAYIQTLPGKYKYIFDLDQPKWRTPKAEIDSFLRSAFVILSCSWFDRARIADIFQSITSGETDRDPTEPPEYDTGQEPESIDHGVRLLTDRRLGSARLWTETAIAAAKHGDTFIYCPTRGYGPTDDARPGIEELTQVRQAYGRCYIFDVDGHWTTEPDQLASCGWIVLRGTVDAQLRELVRFLRTAEYQTVVTN